jgi:hypothetical protein
MSQPRRKRELLDRGRAINLFAKRPPDVYINERMFAANDAKTT